MILRQALMENKKQIDNYLKKYLEEKRQETSRIDGDLSKNIDLIQKQILRSGKRIRPFILNQTYRLSGGKDEELCKKLGAAIELLHQYLLIHDDIVDMDEKRYGDLSLHKIFEKKGEDSHFGISMAMISGDYVNSLVYDIVLSMGISERLKIEILKIISSTILYTTLGWQMHYFQNKVPVSQATEDRYLKGVKLVSAKYTIETPAFLGLILGNNRGLMSQFKEFSYFVGMAFQIQDDVLGVFGDTEKTGKPSGNDLREGKKTLLILRAYKNGTNEQRKYIEKHLGTEIDQQQIDELRDIITQTGSLKYSQETAKAYIARAKDVLRPLDSNNTNSLEILGEMADFMLNREK